MLAHCCVRFLLLSPHHLKWPQVKEAMNDINAAQRLRLAAVEKAEASKVKVVKEAEAEAEAKYLQGAGVARQRQVRMLAGAVLHLPAPCVHKRGGSLIWWWLR